MFGSQKCLEEKMTLPEEHAAIEFDNEDEDGGGYDFHSGGGPFNGNRTHPSVVGGGASSYPSDDDDDDDLVDDDDDNSLANTSTAGDHDQGGEYICNFCNKVTFS